MEDRKRVVHLPMFEFQFQGERTSWHGAQNTKGQAADRAAAIVLAYTARPRRRPSTRRQLQGEGRGQTFNSA